MKKVDFNILRYANCWEDADILLGAFRSTGGKRFLSIGSGGDNSFSLLVRDPEVVTVVDTSKVQLFLIELKKAAFRVLDYDQLLAFLGFEPSDERIKLYNQIKSELSPEACNYWHSKRKQIETGLINCGKFERYFLFFSQKIMPLIHRRKTIDYLFESKSEQEQRLFYQRQWNNLRWRWLFHLFFSKPVMGRFGRDPEFMKQVKIPVSKYIFNTAENHIISTYAQNNYFLHYILSGSFNGNLPHYVRPENYETIKRNLDRLELLHGGVEDILKKERTPFDYFNLSNIFEYMDDQTFAGISRIISEKSDPGCRLVYWNLMVDRKLSVISPGQFAEDADLTKELKQRDNGFFYKNLILETRI